MGEIDKYILFKGATTLSIMTFSIMVKKCETQHNDTEHNGKSLVMLMLTVTYAKCHK